VQGLGRTARAYFAIVIVAALSMAVAMLVLRGIPPPDQWWIWLTFACLTGLAAIVQLFNVFTVKNQACCITLAFVFAALLLLDYSLLAASIMILFIPEWIKNRRQIHIQAFNIANFIFCAFAARALYVWSLDGATTGWRVLAATLIAVATFILVNHGLLALALRAGHGMPLRESGLFQSDSLLIDSGLACVGASLAVLWQHDVWLLIIGAYPLLLIYRSLDLPNLRHAAITDAKTGLYNFKYFTGEAQEELRRAGRYGRPLAVIMADLDLLRNINNTYGHIAGDEVIKEVANIILRNVRSGDIAARFGGEEFTILLPETGSRQALALADRLREQVATNLFGISNSARPIRASLSIGVAAYPDHGSDLNELVYQADLAVRWSKMSGRNRAQMAGPLIAEWLDQQGAEEHAEREMVAGWRPVFSLDPITRPERRSDRGIRRVARQLERALRS
jgi:diguanylate cyclase (GGDEF)-like protein